jgi:hypothetical protein
MKFTPSSASTAAVAVAGSVYVTNPIPEFRPGERPAIHKCPDQDRRETQPILDCWSLARTCHKFDLNDIPLFCEETLDLL